MRTPGGGTATDYPHRSFAAGEGVWVTGVTVQKDGIVFRLYSDAYDGVRYYGELKFSFQKRAVPPPDEALTEIAEVLTVKPADNNEPVAATGLEQVAGLYVMAQATDNRLQLNTDGTLSLVQKGRTYSGTFMIEANNLMLRIGNRKPQAAILQGDTMIDPQGSTWVRQTPARAPASTASFPAAPQPAAPPPAALEAPPPPLEVPPPPPADPVEVKLGQTPEQVVAALGQPLRKAKTPTKEIYFYKDLKVTFVTGKVKDVE